MAEAESALPAQPSKPKANPFGSARPREEVLKEKAVHQTTGAEEPSTSGNAEDVGPASEFENPSIATQKPISDGAAPSTAADLQPETAQGSEAAKEGVSPVQQDSQLQNETQQQAQNGFSKIKDSEHQAEAPKYVPSLIQYKCFQILLLSSSCFIPATAEGRFMIKF